ncbi:MAG: fumarate reductase/succinate dehydrogenase flavoprotein subunit [Bdellovibrionales bacterium]|nr:fumarate reductase/succinate dehydrogenase flavoprotein subunit [Bdellovibrionales bacterium]
MKFFNHIPSGPLEQKWDRHCFELPLVNPANKRKHHIIVVGTGLAGASASASLAELGYQVKTFCIQDSPRRAHSIAAQGGINAAKNYPGDGDSIRRLFYDTIKGGDFRSREANVYRLAQISNQIIDQCVAQGVPFAREYGGLLANRSFGGAQVSRTFYARGQTGQQLLLGAYGALMRQVDKGGVRLFPRHEMMDLAVVEGQVAGVVTRNLLTGEIKSHFAQAVILATGGYGNIFYLSTNAMHSNASAAWRCYKKGAFFANPCFTQIHPTCIPRSGDHQSKLTLLSESLRNDGRIWVPKKSGDKRVPENIPEGERDYYLERIYPSFGNLTPRDLASRQAKFQVDAGKGVGPTGEAVYLDFKEALERRGKNFLSEKYGNLFQIYEKITGENPYEKPMRIYPAVHYTMGGLWVDYNLESTVKGLFVLGEANFSDHGANRLGASALMQGLADGYFIIPRTIARHLVERSSLEEKKVKKALEESVKEVQKRLDKVLQIKGGKTAGAIHRELGYLLWEYVGMLRNEKGLIQVITAIQGLKDQFWKELFIPGEQHYKNAELEKALRVADFLELAELMAQDSLERKESCGSHFREEYQSQEQEALRDDEHFCHVSVWEHTEGKKALLHKEPLEFKEVSLSVRSYK